MIDMSLHPCKFDKKSPFQVIVLIHFLHGFESETMLLL